MIGVGVFGCCCLLVVFMLVVVVPRGVLFVMCCWFGVVKRLLHAGVWCSLLAVSWCCLLYADVVRRSLLVGVVGFGVSCVLLSVCCLLVVGRWLLC